MIYYKEEMLILEEKVYIYIYIYMKEKLRNDSENKDKF